MKITTRSIAAFNLLLGMLVFAFAGAAQAQTPSNSLKAQLIGHWQLVSINSNTSPQPYGADPQGSLFVDAAGHYSVIVISDGGARNVSIFGTYTVDAATSAVTLHVDDSNLRDFVGQDVTRFVALNLNGDELTVTSQLSPRPIPPVTLVWKRAN